MKICPCCKREMPPNVELRGAVKQRIYDYIASRHGVNRMQIMDAVYADDANGGPENLNVISVHICFINKQLRAMKAGVKIWCRGGPGSIYRIVAT